jgi:RNA polymerase sigma factor (sigma-70 family)
VLDSVRVERENRPASFRMPPESSNAAAWFAAEVLPHEAALRAWLRSQFRDAVEADDLVQETYARVLRAHERGEVQVPRAFLFATARNLALDYARRHKIVAFEPITENDARNVYNDGATAADAAAHSQELELLTQAIQSLPHRCRQVLTLRKIYGLSQKQIAAQLGMAEHTVEVQVANGMRRCAQFLARLGLP